MARSSEEEAEAGSGSSSGSEEGTLSDEDESADSSESEDDYSLPAVDNPRRTGRVRRPSSAAAELAAAMREEGEEGSSSSGDEDEAERRQQAPEPAGPEEEEAEGEQQQGGAAAAAAAGGGQAEQRGGGRPSKPGRDGKAAASEGSGSAKRRGLFMLVSEDTAASSGAIHLPQLKPFRPPKPAAAGADEEEGGAEAAVAAAAEEEEEETVCDVCGDGDAVEANLILLCEGKGCRWARAGCGRVQAGMERLAQGLLGPAPCWELPAVPACVRPASVPLPLPPCHRCIAPSPPAAWWCTSSATACTRCPLASGSARPAKPS